jgi:AcrR family transcriptional regulator
MATVRTPRERWVEEGLRALAGGGPGAVRVEPLAKRLGVTKGGFYWHFADRGALLGEMLDAWEHAMVDEVIERIDASDPRERLRMLFAIAAEGAAELMRVERAIRDWARRDAAVAARLRRVDNRRMDYLREQFAAFCDSDDEVEARATTVFALFCGMPFMAADHGGRSRRDVLDLVLSRLLG